jgi:hypothetical protein
MVNDHYVLVGRYKRQIRLNRKTIYKRTCTKIVNPIGRRHVFIFVFERKCPPTFQRRKLRSVGQRRLFVGGRTVTGVGEGKNDGKRLIGLKPICQVIREILERRLQNHSPSKEAFGFAQLSERRSAEQFGLRRRSSTILKLLAAYSWSVCRQNAEIGETTWKTQS